MKKKLNKSIKNKIKNEKKKKIKKDNDNFQIYKLKKKK